MLRESYELVSKFCKSIYDFRKNDLGHRNWLTYENFKS